MLLSRLRHDQPGPVETVVVWLACAAVLVGMAVHAGVDPGRSRPAPAGVVTEDVPGGLGR